LVSPPSAARHEKVCLPLIPSFTPVMNAQTADERYGLLILNLIGEAGDVQKGAINHVAPF
jgi:hypothetical protein